jgi:hypothetical protein
MLRVAVYIALSIQLFGCLKIVSIPSEQGGDCNSSASGANAKRHALAHCSNSSHFYKQVMGLLQQVQNLSEKVVEEEAKLSHLQEEADSVREEEANAEKHALSARTSLLVLEEKYHVAQAALQERKSQLCEVLMLSFVTISIQQ